eukprot:6722143-Ditylum_brightwellii.AAC.1
MMCTKEDKANLKNNESVTVTNSGYPVVKVNKEKEESGDDNSEHEFNTNGFEIVKNSTIKKEDVCSKGKAANTTYGQRAKK